jgi:hypothetical protein
VTKAMRAVPEWPLSDDKFSSKPKARSDPGLLFLGRCASLPLPLGERSTLLGRVRGPFLDSRVGGKAPSPVGCAADLSPKGEVKSAYSAAAFSAGVR